MEERKRIVRQRHENPVLNRLQELFGRSVILEMSRTATHALVVHGIVKGNGGDITLFTLKFGTKIEGKLIEEAQEGAQLSSSAQMSTPSMASTTEPPAGCYHDGIAVGVAGFEDKTTNQIYANIFAAGAAILITAERRRKEEEKAKAAAAKAAEAAPQKPTQEG